MFRVPQVSLEQLVLIQQFLVLKDLKVFRVQQDLKDHKVNLFKVLKDLKEKRDHKVLKVFRVPLV